MVENSLEEMEIGVSGYSSICGKLVMFHSVLYVE